MKAPSLNRALVLEDAFRTPDQAGGFAVVWQALGTLWADISPGTGRELARHELTISRVPLRIIVRAAPVGSPARPNAGQRFREGSRVYTIAGVSEWDTSARFLMCHAFEEVVA